MDTIIIMVLLIGATVGFVFSFSALQNLKTNYKALERENQTLRKDLEAARRKNEQAKTRR